MISFSSRNFVELNIYMRDLRLEIREDQKAYILIDLLSKSLSGIEYMFSNYRLNYIF